jgi:hypothetical protein
MSDISTDDLLPLMESHYIFCDRLPNSERDAMKREAEQERFWEEVRNPELKSRREMQKRKKQEEEQNSWGYRHPGKAVLVACVFFALIIIGLMMVSWYINPQHNATNTGSTTTLPTIAVTTEISGLSVTLNGNIYANAVNQQGQKATMDAQDTTIIWGDGYTSTTLATCATSCSHTYPKSGSYTITIIAVDTIGNKNTNDISVNVLSPAQSTSPPIQHTSSSVQNTHSSSSLYAVIFSGSTQPTYGNMANYKRILVIGNNAYTMGDSSDNYVASNNIPLVNGGTDQDTYVTQNFLHLSCCGDKSIAILETS